MERPYIVEPADNIIPVERLDELRTYYANTDDPVAFREERRQSRQSRRKALGQRAARQEYLQMVFDDMRAEDEHDS